MIESKTLHSDIELCPMVKDSDPFPTLFWLRRETPLHKKISKLEARGWIKALEEFLIANEKARAIHTEDQKAYASLRWQQAKDTIDMSSWSENLKSRLRQSGFGGIAKFNRVRCFHMFYAGHLYQKNLVGRFIDMCFTKSDDTSLEEILSEFESKLDLK